MAEKETAENLVGRQLFSYAELESAWNELKANIENDTFDKNNPPSGGYDIRNGYFLGSNTQGDFTDWELEFSLEDVKKALENVPGVISQGDLEVYYNDNEYNQADSDEHGIFIENGKIKQVY